MTGTVTDLTDVQPESPEFRHLVLLSQSDPEAAVGPLREWLARTPEDSQLAMKLRTVLILAFLFARRLDEASTAATEAAAMAAAAGFPAWQADAIAARAVARWERGERAASAEDAIAAETLIARAGPELAWLSTHNTVAGLYVECGYYELAIDHYRVAAEVNVSSLTGTPGNVADAMNLGWLYLRWTFDDERAGMLTPDDAVYRERMRAARQWYATAGQRGGPEHGWASEFEAGLIIAEACLDPAAHVDRLGRVCQLDLGDDAENDRVIETVRYSYVLRRLGRYEESLRVAQQLVATLDSPTIWLATVREVLYELHRAQLAAKVPGAAEAAGYLDLLLQDLWQANARAMETFRVRRDTALEAARKVEVDLLATHDPLTGVANRRALQAWWQDHPVGPATVAMLDLDGFAEINNRFGHPVGDDILVQAAAALGAAFSAEDRLVRYGGDEFVVLSARLAEPDQVRATIRLALAAIEVDRLAPGARLTACVGVVQAQAGESCVGLLAAADAELIAAKQAADDSPA